MYYILRKENYSQGSEYDTDIKANKSYLTLETALEKKKALETLNDNEHREYIIVQNVS